MEKVDRLSKRPDWKVGVENNNKNQNLIREKQMRSITEVVIEKLETELLERMSDTRRKDKKMVKVVKEIKKDRS